MKTLLRSTLVSLMSHEHEDTNAYLGVFQDLRRTAEGRRGRPSTAVARVRFHASWGTCCPLPSATGSGMVLSATSFIASNLLPCVDSGAGHRPIGYAAWVLRGSLHHRRALAQFEGKLFAGLDLSACNVTLAMDGCCNVPKLLAEKASVERCVTERTACRGARLILAVLARISSSRREARCPTGAGRYRFPTAAFAETWRSEHAQASALRETSDA